MASSEQRYNPSELPSIKEHHPPNLQSDDEEKSQRPNGSDDQKMQQGPNRPEKLGLAIQAFCIFIISLDMTILTPALPTVSQALHANAVESFWIIASYLLANASKALVGVGVISLNLIILSDIVSPRQFPKYQAMMMFVFALGTNVAPVLGGVFVETEWRWIFYINLPFCGIALVAIPLAQYYSRLHGQNSRQLRVCDDEQETDRRNSEGSIRIELPTKLSNFDWIGSGLMVTSSTVFLIGMSWGGNQHPWVSAAVLVPIISALVIFTFTVWYERFRAKNPFLRISIFQHWSGVVASVCTLIQSFLLFAVTLFLPRYLLVCKLYSPLLAGAGLVAFEITAVPVSGITGFLITKLGYYRWAIWLVWAVSALGLGLLVMLDVEISTGVWIVISMCAGAGQGLLLAGHPIAMKQSCGSDDQAHAVCMYAFLRSFGLCLGSILTPTAFQNFLRTRLVRDGLPIAIAADFEGFVPVLQGLDDADPSKLGIQTAYAWGFRMLFATLTGIGVFGLLLSLSISHFTMDTPHKLPRLEVIVVGFCNFAILSVRFGIRSIPTRLGLTQSGEDTIVVEDCEADNCEAPPKSQLWYCPGCSSTYCSGCWSAQTAHKRAKINGGPSMHDKVDIDIIRRYQSSLNPSRDIHVIRKLHEEDQKTQWFGVIRETSRTLFKSHDRYPTLMSGMLAATDFDDRYPKLVSFIGVTNAGKSTLIKMLIERKTANQGKNTARDFPTPVVGSAVHDSLTTSDGVHLYADPATHTEASPFLFADCEGLEGGEKSPFGSQTQEESRQGYQPVSSENARPIEWADTEETCKREYVVSTLYPRLLYTFSDCVVFVLRNPKTFASAVLTKLVAWGSAALERSVNQPTLPHCIVVLNGSDAGIDQSQWDSAHATESLLSTVSNALDPIEGVPQFRAAGEYWQRLGKRIDTIEDLILCYYATFKVVRVPAGPQYTLIDEQVEKLHAAIRAACKSSHEAKRRARLLIGAEELGGYLQSGFDHFVTHLDIPFNFMQVSLAQHPIPQDFGGHILHLCQILSSRIPSWEPAEIQWMLGQLSAVLASCVLLDCARFRKGQLDRLFQNYVGFFDYAITEYLQLHCPCSFVSADGSRMCRSVKARHQIKGHQDEHGIIAAGDYVSPFEDDFAKEWIESLRIEIGKLHVSFSADVEQVARSQGGKMLSEESIAFAFHSKNLRQFYRSLGPSTIRSNSTCLSCVMNTPQHPLPCGHVLCDWCVRACGRLSGTVLRVSWCPLHRDFAHWPQPKIIRYKPPEAGVRVLALDGGGVRGAVQLEILRGIEQAMGNRLPVQAFFDLMVGTGTGGLIVTSLAHRNASLDHVCAQFARICKSAYTTRNPGQGVKNHLMRAFGSRPRYKSSRLCDTLKREFTETLYFFGSSDQFRPEIKTAVVTSDPIRNKTRLVGNYRRESDESSTYDFDRPQNPAMELKTCQAIYATMAEPLHFAPLQLGKHYSGGGSTCKNPASLALAEARKIWPDTVEPDVLLSLGTGQDRKAILAELNSEAMDTSSTDNTASLRGLLRKAQKSSKWLLRGDKDVLDAERAWRDFITADPQRSPQRVTRKCVRLNIDFGQEEPPPHDRESQIRRISTLASDNIQETSLQAALRNVAYRLVATSFFFRVESRCKNSISGRICCRFEERSDEVKGLGLILGDRANGGFQPYFTTLGVPDAGTDRLRMVMSSDLLTLMTEQGLFDLPEITIPLADDEEATSINICFMERDSLEPEGYPISGFPREFFSAGNTSRPLSSTNERMDERTVSSKSDALRSSVSDSIQSYLSRKGVQQARRPTYQIADLTRKFSADQIGRHYDGTSVMLESPPPYNE
ncbi:hypothetical protein Q7P37_009820 [Cladosporium fusiforme]